ncbi:olfactory receptor 6N1-like [Alosa sapidissima]|uniref:olfactory receptor 6N1-like n=1 Tax=Alosa sapidissima TaxID=34773 RepID=UPI001C0A29FA|nr:olfactory receptor 6N1-like [Alosa sapidissima]
MNVSAPVTFFIIEGLQEKKMLMFGVFLTVYVVVLCGNGMIIYLVRTDPKLQTPMYFFLHSLSFSDIVYTSVTIPNMLSGLLKEEHTISKTGCLLQMYFFLSMAVTGRSILTVMAFDRYMAVCNPLRYGSLMTQPVCILLVVVAWCFGSATVLPSLSLAVPLPFCGPNRVKHVFCDHSSVVRLACADTSVNSVVSLTLALFVLLGTFSLILASYVCIGKAVHGMGRVERTKAFTTCASHLIVVCISYVSATCVYVSYRVATFSPDARMIVAVLYSVLTPLLNPIIYSLRNKELWEALTRALSRCPAVPSSHRKTIPTLS